MTLAEQIILAQAMAQAKDGGNDRVEESVQEQAAATTADQGAGDIRPLSWPELSAMAPDAHFLEVVASAGD